MIGIPVGGTVGLDAAAAVDNAGTGREPMYSEKRTLHNMMQGHARVGCCWRPGSVYGSVAPYNPDQMYPEYQFSNRNVGPKNDAYSLVRETLHMLSRDDALFGTPDWNPLGQVIRPGDRVLIKPNAVMDFNMLKSDSLWAVVTHPSVLRAVVDYVFIALKGRGRITIADAPMAQCNFQNWLRHTQLRSVRDLYEKVHGFTICILDLRKSVAPFDWKHGLVRSEARQEINGDPEGYTEVDLRDESEFAEWPQERIGRMYGSDYDQQQTVRYHSSGSHRYLVANSVINSDVVVSVPKLKTHGKVGVTLTLKGMVGAMGDKNYIPHQCIGPVTYGGDETDDHGALANLFNYFRTLLMVKLLSRRARSYDILYVCLERLRWSCARLCRKLRLIPVNALLAPTSGAWYGNDTAWRMTLDLNRIVLCADSGGRLHSSWQRRFLSIVDGICAGEGDGPLFPRERRCGVMLAGENPLWVDYVATQMMGFRVENIPILANGIQRAWLNGGLSWKDVRLNSNVPQLENLEELASGHWLKFAPPSGWGGHLEK